MVADYYPVRGSQTKQCLKMITGWSLDTTDCQWRAESGGPGLWGAQYWWGRRGVQTWHSELSDKWQAAQNTAVVSDRGQQETTVVIQIQSSASEESGEAPWWVHPELHWHIYLHHWPGWGWVWAGCWGVMGLYEMAWHHAVSSDTPPSPAREISVTIYWCDSR